MEISTTICPECSGIKDKRALRCRECKDKEPEYKTCKGCNNSYSIESYNLRPNGRGGLKRRSRCKQCESDYAKTSRQNWTEEQRTAKRLVRRIYDKNNPEKVKNWGRPETKRKNSRRASWKDLGLNPDEIQKLFEEHHGKCEICGLTNGTKALAADHCHSAGKFRGFLCSKCNTGLGFFKDNPELLLAAIEYLKKSNE